MAGFIDPSELDFESYKQKIKEALRTQEKFKDMDFEGSNMSVFLEILARNTYHNGFYLNMVGSEAFLDTAQLRESAVSRSKELNYVPRSRVSSKTLVNILLTPANGENPSVITIPKFYSFSAASSDGTFIFSTDDAIAVQSDGGFYWANNVPISEGRVVTEYFVANTGTRYKIASANVDINSVVVNITEGSGSIANNDWNRAENLYGLDGTSEVFFLQGADSDKYEIVFGNGVTGKKIVNGNVVKVTYRDCSGPDADGLVKFSAVTKLPGVQSISVSPASSPSYGGAEREDIASIKFNAPRHFASQQRAITKSDYVALIKAQFPQVQAIAVFGGEELEQKQYGKVVIAVKPWGAEAAPDALKNLIQSYIAQRTSVSINPIFIDPDYFYVDVKTKVYFDSTLTSKAISTLRLDVLAAVSQFASKNLSDFASDLRGSRLIAAIDAADKSIVSNDTQIRGIKRISPRKGQEQSHVIEFKSKLKKSKDKVTLSTSNFFWYSDKTETTYTAFIEDDGAGNLHVFTFDAQSKKTKLVDKVGTVNYDNGKVLINDLMVQEYVGYINIYVELFNSDFIVKQNQIILIDPDDVSVSIEKAAF